MTLTIKGSLKGSAELVQALEKFSEHDNEEIRVKSKELLGTLKYSDS